MAETNKGKGQRPADAFGEHMRAAGQATVRQWRSLLPDKFWESGREARREFLLAMRSAVDVVIERLEGETGAPPTKPGGKRGSTRKVKVEVE